MKTDVKDIIESFQRERGSVPAYIQMFAEFEPDILRDWYVVRKDIFEKGVIPRKYKELFVMGMCFAQRYPGGIGHMKAAMDLGATKEEIFEAIMLTIPGVGIPAFATAVNALKTLLDNKENKDRGQK